MTAVRLLFGVAAALFLVVAEQPQTALALDSKAIKKAIEEYVDAGTSEEQRKNLILVLSKAPNSDVAKALKSSVRKENERSAALELAIALHLRGLFSSFAKFFDEAPEQTTRLGFITLDKGALKALHKRWAEAPMGSDAYKVLNDAFLKYCADSDAIKEFAKIVADEKAGEERREAAAEVVRFQLGLDTSNPTEIALKWDEFEKELRDKGESFEIKGFNLFAYEGWERYLSRRVAGNALLVEKTVLRLEAQLPPALKEPGYTFAFWIKPEKDFECLMGLLITKDSTKLIHGLDAKAGNWVVNVSGTDKKFPFQPGKWQQVKIRVFQANGSTQASVYIDDQVFLERSSFSAPGIGYAFQCTAGTAVLSSLDLYWE